MNRDTIAVVARHYIPTLFLAKQVGSECAVDGTIAVKLVIERSDSPHRQEAVLIRLGNYTDHDDLIIEVTGGQRTVGIWLSAVLPVSGRLAWSEWQISKARQLAPA